jgi:hypothetical protein
MGRETPHWQAPFPDNTITLAAVQLATIESATEARFILNRDVGVEGGLFTDITITQNDTESFCTTVAAVLHNTPLPGYTTLILEFAVGEFDNTPATWSVPPDGWIVTTPSYDPAPPYTGDVTIL